MDPTDYQTSAIYGPVPNNSAIDATMLKPAASGPDDWTTILTNGLSNAAVLAANGWAQNHVDAGQIQNAIAATPLRKNGATINLMPLLLIGAVVLLLVK